MHERLEEQTCRTHHDFLGVSFLIFLVTGYTALYWAWTRGNLGVINGTQTEYEEGNEIDQTKLNGRFPEYSTCGVGFEC
jgi:hypothetical protein